MVHVVQARRTSHLMQTMFQEWEWDQEQNQEWYWNMCMGYGVWGIGV